jgi:N-acetylglucosamine kinase-like BadF-type ATPase
VFTINGPVTIHVHGPTAEEIRTVVATEITAALNPLENKMTQISDFLDATNATADQVNAAVADIAADVAVLLAAVPAGTFTTDEQAKADALAAKLTAVTDALGALDTAVGDQDGSDTPAPVE